MIRFQWTLHNKKFIILLYEKYILILNEPIQIFLIKELTCKRFLQAEWKNPIADYNLSTNAALTAIPKNFFAINPSSFVF